MKKNLDESFRSVITQSGLPLALFAKATETSPLKTLKWWSKEQDIFLTDRQITNFENHFAIPTESITKDTANIQLLRRRIFGDLHALPEKYEIGANSYVRSSYYIIRYLSFLYGREFTDKLLTSLEVHPGYMDNLDKKINILFVTDLLNKCKEFGFTQSDFKNLANSMFLSVEDTPVESLFSNITNYEEFYHQFKIMTGYFDQNFTYDFVIGSSGADFITRPSEELQYLIDKYNYDISILYTYRPMLFAQGPQLGQLTGLDLQIKSCISRGDRFCRYRVDFSRPPIRVV